MKIKYKWYRKLYAELFGYFWMPCPICGNMFGGQEVKRKPVFLRTERGKGRIVCPGCCKKAIQDFKT